MEAYGKAESAGKAGRGRAKRGAEMSLKEVVHRRPTDASEFIAGADPGDGSRRFHRAWHACGAYLSAMRLKLRRERAWRTTRKLPAARRASRARR